jgi:hypothetical protein
MALSFAVAFSSIPGLMMVMLICFSCSKVAHDCSQDIQLACTEYSEIVIENN